MGQIPWTRQSAGAFAAGRGASMVCLRRGWCRRADCNVPSNLKRFMAAVESDAALGSAQRRCGGLIRVVEKERRLEMK